MDPLTHYLWNKFLVAEAHGEPVGAVIEAMTEMGYCPYTLPADYDRETFERDYPPPDGCKVDEVRIVCDPSDGSDDSWPVIACLYRMEGCRCPSSN